MQYKRREGLTVQSIDDELLILDLEGHHIHQLNATAGFIWEKIDEADSLEHLIEMFSSQYDVGMGTAKSDVEKVLNQLCEMRLVEKD